MLLHMISFECFTSSVIQDALSMHDEFMLLWNSVVLKLWQLSLYNKLVVSLSCNSVGDLSFGMTNCNYSNG